MNLIRSDVSKITFSFEISIFHILLENGTF